MLDGIRDVEIVGEAEDEAGPSSPSPSTSPTWCCSTYAYRAERLDICRRLGERHAGVKVVFLTVYEDEQYVFEALRAGARATC